MAHLIFCFGVGNQDNDPDPTHSIKESKPFIRRDSSANDVCSMAAIILFPASMIVETCSHESGTGRPQMRRG